MLRAATSGRALVALAGVAVVLAFALSASGAPRPKEPSRSFKLAGSVGGLYPGGLRTLAVTVRNPYRRDLRLVSLRVRVRRAGPACAASNIAVQRFRGFVDVRPRRAGVVRLVVRMARSAGDGCRGARFPLEFTAKGILW